MIKLTFFKWLLPEGNWINEKGVKPTVEIKQPDYYYSNPIKVDKPFKLDESDDNIETAQIILDGLGYNLDRKDGYFDKDTVAALKEFQSEHSLSETGELDEETASARSEEHTSELQSVAISYAVFCLKKKKRAKIQCLIFWIYKCETS